MILYIHDLLLLSVVCIRISESWKRSIETLEKNNIYEGSLNCQYNPYSCIPLVAQCQKRGKRWCFFNKVSFGLKSILQECCYQTTFLRFTLNPLTFVTLTVCGLLILHVNFKSIFRFQAEPYVITVVRLCT